MKIMNTNLENISHQKFLNINYGLDIYLILKKGIFLIQKIKI